jgi:hypothetical protein
MNSSKMNVLYALRNFKKVLKSERFQFVDIYFIQNVLTAGLSLGYKKHYTNARYVMLK